MIFAPGIFDGNTALVTGGGTGIGRQVALLLARSGARVAIASRKKENLEGTAKELSDIAGPDRVFHQPCDIREPEQIAALVEAVMAKLGPVDLLVNNAGGQFPSPAERITPKGWDAVIRNNLNGTFYMTREVATRCMIPNRRGKIVNVTAQVFRGFPGMAHTGAARAGVENMTMTLAIEWAQHRITVNAVAPGVIKSSGTAKYIPELVEMGRQKTPLKRLGTEEEVAASIVYLLSPAADFVTGATLYIDGGARLWGENWPIPEPR
ncbi:MAG: SDR family oxidoreductase [Deltaproteobacteria bacterium]|nr:SDR family oxidoreductase [Deltaproteobacteria bacterium]